MSIYKYTATDSKGNKRSGTVDASTRDIAVELLKKQNLYVISLDEKQSSIVEALLSFRGVSSSDLVGFTRQFSTMISAGLPVSQALSVLATQTESSFLKKVLFDVLKLVEGGLPLSKALGRYPKIFSPTYRALVRAGESSGNLDEILNRLAYQMEEKRELNAKFKGAMIYPGIVFVAMIAVFFILMIFVIPKLADMYKDLDVTLPVMTQIMIAVSDFMVAHAIIIVSLVVIIFIGVRAFLRTEEGRELSSEVTFVLPVFGKINKLNELDQFTSTLALLLSSAVPIIDSLDIVSEVAGTKAFKMAAKDASDQVEKGRALSDYFRSNPIFPPIVAQMASVGEETGKMDEVLEKVAKYFRSEMDHLVIGLSAALEPIILVLLGGMVGFLIISIITPIYKITSAL